MSYKVLLADDSLTIQKVIKITLAEEPIALTVASSLDDLNDKLDGDEYDLLLLDFGLSEDRDGYQITQDIRQKKVTMPIIMMFGTFDTIDENKLSDIPVEAKIVKPFDSAKFIQTCRSFLLPEDEIQLEQDNFDDIEEEDVEAEITQEEELPVEDNIEVEEWVVNSPEVPMGSDDMDDIPEIIDNSNELEQSVADWAIEVPPIIAEEGEEVSAEFHADEDGLELPPVIDGEEDSNKDQFDLSEVKGEVPAGIPASPYAATESNDDIQEVREENQEDEVPQQDEVTASFVMPTELLEDKKIPDPSQLEYPSADSTTNAEEEFPSVISESEANDSNEDEQDSPSSETPSTTSKLIPLTELTPEEESSMTIGDTTDTDIRINLDNTYKAETISSEISDEKDEEDFWAIDDEGEVPAPIEAIPAAELPQEAKEDDEVEMDRDIEQKMQFNAGDTAININVADVMKDFDMDSLTEEVKSKIEGQLEPIIKAQIEGQFEQIIEKIAWEVIPDLAENLIKKELGKITESVVEE